MTVYALFVTVLAALLAVTLWDLRQRPPGRHHGRSNVRATINRLTAERDSYVGQAYIRIEPSYRPYRHLELPA